MKKITVIFTSILIGNSAWGLTRDFDNHISVNPTNAAGHGITFSYYAPIPAIITIEMPYVIDKAAFDQADLVVSAGEQHFKIPLRGEKNEKGKLTLAFWMDRKTLRLATLRIRFEEKGKLEGTVFVIQCKDFVSETQEPHNQPSDRTR